VSARFLGFAPESAAPSIAASGGVAVSIVAIHFGMVGSRPRPMPTRRVVMREREERDRADGRHERGKLGEW
jgi:hypothetical protein